jgi:hypothetical protein
MSLDYTVVLTIGILIGVGELVSRYRDAPLQALKTPPAALYIAINALAAVGALAALVIFRWSPASSSGELVTRILRISTAGFGAMAVFRSSLFVVRVGEQDVPVGPGAFLQIVLGACDRAVDRVRAAARADSVSRAMTGVDFKAAYAALPAFCLALMQNLPDDDQKALARQIQATDQSSMDPETKSLLLGLALMNAVGEGVLSSAVVSLAPQIKAVSVVTIVGFDATESIPAGKRIQLRAEAKDQTGKVIQGKAFAWASTTPAVANVDALGIVTGTSAGKSDISATAGGVTATVNIQVQ